MKNKELDLLNRRTKGGEVPLNDKEVSKEEVNKATSNYGKYDIPLAITPSIFFLASFNPFGFLQHFPIKYLPPLEEKTSKSLSLRSNEKWLEEKDLLSPSPHEQSDVEDYESPVKYKDLVDLVSSQMGSSLMG